MRVLSKAVAEKSAGPPAVSSQDTECWKQLELAFVAAVADPNKSWVDIWNILVDGECFQKMLSQAARRSVPRWRKDSAYWSAEVQQYVQLRLGRKLQASRGLGFFPERGSLRAWLRSVIVNECRSYWRRQRLIREIAAGTGEEAEAIADRVSSGTSEQQTIQCAVRAVIEGLNEPYRTLAKLWADGRKQAEMARLLNLTAAQVRRRKQKLAGMLSRALAEHGPARSKSPAN